LQIALSIAVVEKDIPPIVPANGNVADCTFELSAKRPSHSDRLRSCGQSGNP